MKKVKIEILSKVSFQLNTNNLDSFINDKIILSYSNDIHKLLKSYIEQAINNKIADIRLFFEMLENYLGLNNKKLSLIK